MTFFCLRLSVQMWWENIHFWCRRAVTFWHLRLKIWSIYRQPTSLDSLYLRHWPAQSHFSVAAELFSEKCLFGDWTTVRISKRSDEWTLEEDLRIRRNYPSHKRLLELKRLLEEIKLRINSIPSCEQDTVNIQPMPSVAQFFMILCGELKANKNNAIGLREICKSSCIRRLQPSVGEFWM